MNIRRLPRLHLLFHHNSLLHHTLSLHPALLHNPRPAQQILHFALSPPLFLLALNLRTTALRTAIPPLAQLRRRRLLEALPDRQILLERLKDVDIRRTKRGAEARDSEFEDNSGDDDDDEGGPPGRVSAEAGEEGVADVIDDVVLVGGGEDDVPEEPAADGEDEGEGHDEALGVHLDELHLDVDEDDDGGEGQVAHGEEVVVLREEHLAEEAEHAEEDEDRFRAAHEHPAEVEEEVEAAVALALGVEFGNREKGGRLQVAFEDAEEDDREGREEGVEHAERP